MPTETRKIVFSDIELAEAIERFAKATRHAMPPGRVTACRIDAKIGLSAMLTVTHLADGSSNTVRFDQPSIAAALIRYCMEKKIPIARSSEKTVEAIGSGVALTLRMGNAAPLPS